MNFRVSTASFSHAVRTLAPFVDPDEEIIVELRRDHGYLAAECAGHRVRSPFPIEGSGGERAFALPLRIASSVCDIEENFAGQGTRAEMRIDDRAGGAVFSYEAAGARCEFPARPVDGCNPLGYEGQVSLGEVDAVAFGRALRLTADVLGVPRLEESRRVIALAMYEGTPAALATTAHERIIVEGAGLVAGLRVPLATAPLLVSFLARTTGAVSVTASDTHGCLTDAADQSFSFTQAAAAMPSAPARAPVAASDVVVRANAAAFVKALSHLTCNRSACGAGARLERDGKLWLDVRDGERGQVEIPIPTIFLSEPRELGFRLAPHALLRLLGGYEAEEIELRLTTGGTRPHRAAQLLSTTETILDGALRVHRVAALTI